MKINELFAESFSMRMTTNSLFKTATTPARFSPDDVGEKEIGEIFHGHELERLSARPRFIDNNICRLVHLKISPPS